MAAQLRRIVECADLPSVTVRVVPFRAGLYAGVETGPFGMLDFPVDAQVGGLPTMVYLNRFDEHVLLDKDKDVAIYEARWGDVCADALDEADSTRLIDEAARRYADQ
jgi:hypothetical protein